MKIVALTTCHNRRDLTLRALKSLHQQILPADHCLEVCLVDDGCTDGTGDIVRARYPDVVVLKGAGNLFWAGGMRFGWEHFVKQKEMDYLLVFNDDVELYPNAIEVMLLSATAVSASGCNDFAIAGAFREPDTGETSYGAVVHNSPWHPLRFGKVAPAKTIQDCDTLNMNLALISVGALKRIGFLSKEFIHSKADFDYGLRLRAEGGRVVLAPGFTGTCASNSNEKADESNIPFKERWRRLTSNKEQPLRERAVLYRRHAGFLWPLFWLLPYLNVCVGSVKQWFAKSN